MNPPPEDSVAGSTGPPDRQILRLLERQLMSDPVVAETKFEPDSHEPRLLRALLDAGRYPDVVAAARVDVRWFTTGDFSIHYFEDRDDDSLWECRWDRHPNAHNARLHFHEPPTGAEISNLDLLSLHPLDVYSTTFEAIEQRIESLW
ncbi:hypothetical protein [Halobaculum magnesiiphilum]|uniref:Uncharacterized protein n=1 Tax=Halobaculum magnesiiphilum TaxID=1017351 RepID=A0A8T8WHF5_9EURY|nr:hypothetical protein [Halobaculum magnesiiphilum]QZP39174.1 hypothetical protein K6T50_16040 [Halobaculum magnesiiphilum]